MDDLYKKESELLAKMSAFHIYTTKGQEGLMEFFPTLLRFCSENRKRTYQEVKQRLMDELALKAQV